MDTQARTTQGRTDAATGDCFHPMRIVGPMALAIVATAGMAAADTAGPSVDGCVELLAGVDESGPVSNAELWHKLKQLLDLCSRPIRQQLPDVLLRLPEWSDLCCGLRVIKRLRSTATATVLQLQLVW